MFFCVSILVGLSANAQDQDFQLWSQVGIKYDLNKKSDIKLGYRLDLKENASTFRRTNLVMSYDRKLTKWLDIELYYRFITSYEQDKHRLRVALSTDKKLSKRTIFKFRTLVQHDFEYFDIDYLQSYKPDFVWRNRFMLKQDLPKKFTALAYTEPFIIIDNNSFKPYRLRTGIGINYDINKWTFGCEYFYQYEFDIKSPQNLSVLGLNADYDITRVLRPKKKGKKKKYKSKDLP